MKYFAAIADLWRQFFHNIPGVKTIRQVSVTEFVCGCLCLPSSVCLFFCSGVGNFRGKYKKEHQPNPKKLNGSKTKAKNRKSRRAAKRKRLYQPLRG